MRLLFDGEELRAMFVGFDPENPEPAFQKPRGDKMSSLSEWPLKE